MDFGVLSFLPSSKNTAAEFLAKIGFIFVNFNIRCTQLAIVYNPLAKLHLLHCHFHTYEIHDCQILRDKNTPSNIYFHVQEGHRTSFRNEIC